MPEDDPREKFVRIDRNDRVIGPVDRGMAHRNPDIIHRAITVLVVNNKGQVLMQKRSKNKDLYPGCWALSCGGHVNWGDTYHQAAKRELEEELGLKGEIRKINKFFVEILQEREMIEVYVLKHDQMPETFDPIEIDELKWIDWSKLKSGRSEDDITPLDKIIINNLPNRL